MTSIARVLKIALISVAFTLFSISTSQAAVELDAAAIEAEIAAAVADGMDPMLAAKEALANAIAEVIAANPDYPGGEDALIVAVMDALATLQIPGLDAADTLAVANHVLGIESDTDLEAYEAPAGGGPGAQGRGNARNRGGHAYGPGGNPNPGSPT